MKRKNRIGGNKPSVSDVATKARKGPSTIVVFGLCRLGFLIALCGYVVLLADANWMLFAEGKADYLWKSLGYDLIASVLVWKAIAIWWKKHGSGVRHFVGGNPFCPRSGA